MRSPTGRERNRTINQADAIRLNFHCPITTQRKLTAPDQPARNMIKTFSLSVLFFLTLGLMFAAYASVPSGL